MRRESEARYSSKFRFFGRTSLDSIRIRGARTHNLTNTAVALPRNRLVVITGLSGAGKSSLAFDTLYAEGQRRYVESLSAYARQFLELMEKPDVDLIEGLSPAIAIEQKAASHNPRSTVGTVTEIHDYLRLLFARAGTPYCPQHGTALQAHSVSQMVDQLLALPQDTRLMVLAPVVAARKGEQSELLDELRAQGFSRVRIDGRVHELDAAPRLAKNRQHSIDVVVDRLRARADAKQRLAESLETALRHADERHQRVVLYGSGKEAIAFEYPGERGRAASKEHPFEGVVPNLERRYRETDSLVVREELAKLIAPQLCPECAGARLRREARHVRLAEHSLHDISRWPLGRTAAFFRALKLAGAKGQIAERIVREIANRLEFLINVGLDYLSLERSADTLSGGEAQRIRLASQIGSGLTGVMYVLDEPSIGLHQRDNARLIDTLKRLRDLGNSVIVVEHDEEAIAAADHVLDMGPGAGIHGGEIVAQGTPAEILRHPGSLTGQYLSGRKVIAMP